MIPITTLNNEETILISNEHSHFNNNNNNTITTNSNEDEDSSHSIDDETNSQFSMQPSESTVAEPAVSHTTADDLIASKTNNVNFNRYKTFKINSNNKSKHSTNHHNHNNTITTNNNNHITGKKIILAIFVFDRCYFFF